MARDGPHFLGHIIHHMVLDPRDGKTLLATASTGHLGPTLFRSTDFGKSWTEATRPPAFQKLPEGQKGRSINHTFWLTPAHANEPNVWYGGTSPQGLFRSEDGGATWSEFSGLNDDPQYRVWFGTQQDGTPNGPRLHSIIVDPRDPKHLYFGMSGGGVHETRDGGAHWAPLIDGMEVVAGFDASNLAFHDPHCVRMCPSNPDRLYQQNHCGIYRLDRPAETWARIGKAMPPRHRRCRLSHGGASARRQSRLGAADGRPDRVAAHQRGGQARRLWHRERRQELDAAGQGLAQGASLVDGQTPGLCRRQRHAGRALFRHHQRRTVGQPQ